MIFSCLGINTYDINSDEYDIYSRLNPVVQKYREKYNMDFSRLYEENDKEIADVLAEQMIIGLLITTGMLDTSILYEIYDTETAVAMAETFEEGYIYDYCMT